VSSSRPDPHSILRDFFGLNWESASAVYNLAISFRFSAAGRVSMKMMIARRTLDMTIKEIESALKSSRCAQLSPEGA